MKPLPILLTAVTLIAFAANSVLCRLALGEEAIDPYSFTAIRFASGALLLQIIVRVRQPPPAPSSGSWRGGLALALYAVPFSLAYTRIAAGTGALLLFGAVQVTMMAAGLRGGERPTAREWLALAGACGGLVYLVSPGLTAPDPIGAALMAVAGAGWGLYSLIGKGASDPLGVTAGSFLRSSAIIVPFTFLAWPFGAVSLRGVLLALASGIVASGLGYVVWYAALRHLTTTRAALVQLAVPVLAAAGGVAFIAETVTARLAIAGAVTLGSIALGVTARRPATTSTSTDSSPRR